MHRRTTGVVFIGFAVFMLSVHYLIGAPNERDGLLIASAFALVAGVSYLIIAELLEYARNNNEDGEQESRTTMLKQIKENWQHDFDDEQANKR